MTSSAHGVLVDQGALPPRSIVLAAGKALIGAGSSADPVPTDVTNSSAGTYTPTFTNAVNISASTANLTTYFRIGNVVHVAGVLSATITTTNTNSSLDISLPIASALTAAAQLSGVGAGPNTAHEAYPIVAEPTADTARMAFNPTVTGATVIPFNFTYQVL